MTDLWQLWSNPDGSARHLQTLPVHVALLPSGKVVFFSGSEHDEAPLAMARTGLFDPVDGTVSYVDSPAEDLFCAGHCMLPGGEVFVAGGTDAYDKDAPEPHKSEHHFTGISTCRVFDWRSETWHDVPSMASTRWYPTCIALPDGRALVMSGHGGTGATHENTTVELFDPENVSWTAASPTVPAMEDTGTFILVKRWYPMIYYPRLHVLPWNGQVLSATALQVDGVRETRSVDPDTLALTTVGDPPPGLRVSTEQHVYARSAFSSVLLPLRPPHYGATILICGEAQPRKFQVNNAHLGWQPAGARRPYTMRAYLTTVLLPDGTVLAVGGGYSERGNWDPTPTIQRGGDDAHAIAWAERYLPDEDRWERLSAPTTYPPIPRMYHSVALLLPDGRVWIAGSNHGSARNHGGVNSDHPERGDARELRVDIYSPPYLFAGQRADGTPVPASRPVIERVRHGAAYGQDLTVHTPDARHVDKVVLIRCASVTHAYSSDQRYVELVQLPGGRGPDWLRVSAPPTARVAPPGYYMLFLINDTGRPSVAAMVRIGDRYPLLELSLGRRDIPGLGVVGVPGEPLAEDLGLFLGVLGPGERRTGVVRLKNVGSGTLRVTAAAVYGHFHTDDIPASPFTGRPAVPRNLELAGAPAGAGPNAWVELELTYTADDYGEHVGELELLTNIEDAPIIRISLAAHVVGLELRLPGGPLDLGRVPAGTTATVDLSVSNVGTVPAVLSDLLVDAPFGVLFTLPGLLVPVGQVRTLPVSFRPEAAGRVRGELVLVVDGAPAPSRFHREYRLALNGTGLGPRAALAPVGLTFGEQRGGTTSAPQQVRVMNVGTETLVIERFAVDTDFRVLFSGPAELQPGAALDLDVVFRPGHGGPLVGSMRVVSNAPGPAATVELSGTGLVEPVAAVDPPVLDFGPRTVGVGGPALPVTVHSAGPLPLAVQSATVTGPHAADFTTAVDGCSGTAVQPEAACVVTMAFQPGGTGVRTAVLSIQDNAATSPEVVALTGVGTAAGARSVDPAAISFGSLLVGDSAVRRVTLTNSGSGPLLLAGADLVGADPGDFTVHGDSAGHALVPGEQFQWSVAFTPSQLGVRRAGLRITDDGPGSPTAVAVEGIGLAAVVQFDRAEVVFPMQLVGSLSQREEVVLTNVGNSPLALDSVTVAGDFHYRTSCETVLRPGGSCTTQIVFNPQAVGLRTGALHATHSGTGTVHEVPLRGVGAVPVASCTPQSLDFGAVTVGTGAAPQVITVVNSGAWVLTIDTVAVGGDDAGDFAVSGAGGVFRSGESAQYTVVFTPTALGPRRAELRLTTNVGAAPVTVPLQGAGTAT